MPTRRETSTSAQIGRVVILTAAVAVLLTTVAMIAVAAIVARNATHPVSYTHLDVYKRQLQR